MRSSLSDDNAWHHYDENHDVRSAQIIAPYVMELLQVNSVVDVGCGVAQWARVFRDLGADRVVGIDGTHVPRAKRLIDDNEFIEGDLASPPVISGRFDLVVSLEVAEHLRSELAESYCDYLASLGDVILFSAAIPGQTGENHVNEQPHEYWHQRFQSRGYQVFDVFRSKFWCDDRINWWYRQNMYLFAKNPSKSLKDVSQTGFTAIHPELLALYSRRVEELESQLKSISLASTWKGKLAKVLLGKSAAR